MADTPSSNPERPAITSEKLREDGLKALAKLFEEMRGLLTGRVARKLDDRLRARVGASDVVQSAFVDLVEGFNGYLADPKLPLRVWILLTVAQKLVDLHREHLGTKKRDVRREVKIDRPVAPGVDSTPFCEMLAARLTSPTQAARRNEMVQRTREAFDQLADDDRIILILRQYLELDRAESAEILEITEDAAAKRYYRALERLKRNLDTGQGEPEEF